MQLTEMDWAWAESVAGRAVTEAEAAQLKQEFEQWLDWMEQQELLQVDSPR